MSSDPAAIYQDWLDKASGPILQADGDQLLEFFSLPYLHQAKDNRTVIETREDLVSGMQTFSASLHALGANQYIRLVDSAEYLNDDYISGVHVTHVLRNATPVMPGFVTQIVLRRFTKTWKLVENIGEYAHGTWPVRIMRVAQCDTNSLRASKTDARRDAAQPMALYQRFLNALTRTNVAGDFDAYCSMLNFPYTSHTLVNDDIICDKSEVRPFFDTLSELLERHKIDNCARIADHAEFISGDTICGYHTTHFMRDGTHALEAVKSRMILRRTGTHWFLHSVTNALAKDHVLYADQDQKASLITQRAIQERTKT